LIFVDAVSIVDVVNVVNAITVVSDVSAASAINAINVARFCSVLFFYILSTRPPPDLISIPFLLENLGLELIEVPTPDNDSVGELVANFNLIASAKLWVRRVYIDKK